MKRYIFIILTLLSSSIYAANTLTHNFWGFGEGLGYNGIDVTASYTMDVAANPIGGEKKGFAQAGSLGLGIIFDLDHLFNWTGWSLNNSWVWRSGNSLTKEKINNQFNVQQVWGGQNFRLNELFIQNAVSDVFLFKAGRLDAGNDFLASPLYCDFMNNGFCGNPVGIFFNGVFSAYPNAQWAAYLSFKPIDTILAKFGIYNTNASVSQNHYHGMDWEFENDVGVQLITEWVYLVNQEEYSPGLPGNYKVGFMYYTGNFPEFLGDSHKGNYNYYFLFDQTVYRHEECGCITDRGLTPFIGLIFGPKNRNEFPFFGVGGLVYQGLFPQRPLDTTALGFIYGSYSKDMRLNQNQAKSFGIMGPYGNMPQTYEAVIELSHNFIFSGWFSIMPDVQYIINPKGYGTIDNALVVGFQFNVNI
ncbi:MAG: carbohydrate porin [Parachlamydiales bacterium]|nr:carbohydrate porin [Parachlamydiales bacterium]